MAAPIALTATNSSQAAKLTLDPIVNGFAGASFTAVESTPVLNASAITRTAGSLMRRINGALTAPQTVLGATTTIGCALSGNISMSDNSSAGAAPTSLTMTFNSCSDVAGETMNGTLSISGISGGQSGNLLTMAASVSMNLTIATTGQPTQSMTGSWAYSMTLDTTTFAVTAMRFYGSSFAVTDSTHSFSLTNFDFNATGTATDTTTSVAYTISDSSLGSVTVATTTPVHQLLARLHPDNGVIVATGGRGSKLRVTILGDETAAAPQLRIEVDADGNGSYESTVTSSWTALGL